jgi:hypothetical protein
MIKFKNGLIITNNPKIEKTTFGVLITNNLGLSIEISNKVWQSLQH